MSTLTGTMLSIEAEISLILPKLSPSKRQSLIDYAKFLYTQNESESGRIDGERPSIKWVSVSPKTIERSIGCVAYEGDSLLDTEALYDQV